MTEKIVERSSNEMLSAKRAVQQYTKSWKTSPTCCERYGVLFAVAFPPSSRYKLTLHVGPMLRTTRHPAGRHRRNAAEGVREITLTPTEFIVSAVPPVLQCCRSTAVQGRESQREDRWWHRSMARRGPPPRRTPRKIRPRGAAKRGESRCCNG